MRLQSTVFGAFAQALPDVVPAACGDGGPLINLRTTDSRTGRRLMANLDPITGGGGGTSFRDGTEGSGANFGFLKNTPVEINEAEVPVKILRYGLAPDSGGAGRYRGGTGTTLEFQVSSPDTVVTARNRDRSRFTPWGSRGGDAGKPSEFLLNPGTQSRGQSRQHRRGDRTARRHRPDHLGGRRRLGQTRSIASPRACSRTCGGASSPSAKAKDEYGVVIRDGAVDAAGTKALRARLASERPRDDAGFGFNPARVDFERVWTRANYERLIALLGTLPVEWRFFVKHRVFEAIERLPERERTGGGAEVDRVFRQVTASYAQLKAVVRAAE